MGKSLGNMYTLKDVEDKGFSPLDLRYFFFMAQYGSFQNFTREGLGQARKTRENLQKKIGKAAPSPSLDSSLRSSSSLFALNDEAKGGSTEGLVDLIDEAMKDNLNTPKLLSIVNNALSSPNEAELAVLYRLEKNILKVGLFDLQEIPPTPLYERGQVPTHITDLANQRLVAKAEKNYTLADELRNQIQEKGYIIKDISGGFEIEKI